MRSLFKSSMLMLCMMTFSALAMAGPVDGGYGAPGFSLVDNSMVADADVMVAGEVVGRVTKAGMFTTACNSDHKISNDLTDKYSLMDVGSLDKSYSHSGLSKAQTATYSEYDLRMVPTLAALQRTSQCRDGMKHLKANSLPPGEGLRFL